MEFVDGNTLKNIIKEKKKIPLPEAIYIFSQVLEGIAYAHSRGVVHRDIKPSNIFLAKDRRRRVKIGDFGIAKVAGIDGLTKMGSTMGSPLYSSPEQLLGKKTDARTDVYSLGITFYEMITGTLPFKPTGDSEYKVIREVLDTTIRKPSELEKSIPPAVDTLIMKSLAKSPEDRFQSVTEFETAVKGLAITTPQPTAAPAPAAGTPKPGTPKPAKMGPGKIATALDKIKSRSAALGVGDRKKGLTVALVLGIILVLLILFLISSIGNDQIPQTTHTTSSGQMPQPGTGGTSSGISNFIQPGSTITTPNTAAPITTKPLLGTGDDLSNTSAKMAGLIKNGEYSKADRKSVV
jgi:serine/threonine protein kinase